jgi:N-acetylglucosamine-6-phosphate deacetylase
MVRCGTLVLPKETLRHVTVIARDGVIERVTSDTLAETGAAQIDASESTVVPGFVDIHVHGALDCDTMDATPQTLEVMSTFYASHGVTSFLPTTMTETREHIDAALDNIKLMMARGVPGAQILGAHVEGPFLNAKQCGAQSPDLIRPARREEYGRWFDLGIVRLMTIAPEIAENSAMIEDAQRAHVTLAIGHSDADYATACRSFTQGVTQATHTFNGMRGLHHREPGTAGAVLASDDVVAQVIADNVHVHPGVMKIIYKCKTAERLALITDAIEAVGLGDGTYRLGPQDITVRNGQARTASGSLAGSTLTLDVALRNIMKATGCRLNEAVEMATLTPARSINVGDRKGNVAPGYDADLTVLNADLEVQSTIVGGKVVYTK